MKKLITLLTLSIVCFCCQAQMTAQTGTITLTPNGISYNPTLTRIREMVSMLFAPDCKANISEEEVAFLIRKMFFDSFKGSLAEFDIFAASHKYQPCKTCIYVDVRIEVNGKITDYTFEEFKQKFLIK